MMRWFRFITTPPATPAGVAKREEQPTTGVHYDTEWAHGPGSRLVRTIGVWGFMKPAISIYGSPKVIGADRLDTVEGPVIFAANHHSHADTTLLLATIPAHLRERLAIAAGAGAAAHFASWAVKRGLQQRAAGGAEAEAAREEAGVTPEGKE